LDISDPVPENMARLARYHLNGVALANRLFLRRNAGRVPELYSSGVRFRNEPWAGGELQIEQFAQIPEIWARRWGDCAQLCGWRVAEQRERLYRELRSRGTSSSEAERQARKAYDFRIYWRIFDASTPDEKRVFHVQVRNPDGSVEDPSRLLEQE
jgi:hypothetical protein